MAERRKIYTFEDMYKEEKKALKEYQKQIIEDRKNFDLSYFRETSEEVEALSGKDRDGNYWSAVPVWDFAIDLYRITFQSTCYSKGWDFWNIDVARNPDECLDTLIADGDIVWHEKYQRWYTKEQYKTVRPFKSV